ncbi:24339_t:CDS:2, partial [Cetraspora pellucida]
EQDVALVASVDGYQIFRQKTNNCWIVLVINANLAFENHVKKENLLINIIIPRPKEPKDINTYLFSMIKELHKRDINCYDAFKEEYFILHAVIVNWSGDTPELTKLMGITEHNSYKGCQYCNLRGVRTNHIYYPTTPPPNFNSERYYIMHLFYENIAKYMFEHWTGTFFSDELQNREPYVLAKSTWLDIGKQMHAWRKNLLPNLRRPLRNIILHYYGYKAKE